MRILVITDVLWRNDNGVGNSYSNIFEGMENVLIENICCQQGISQNSVSQACFQISEKLILQNLKNKNIPCGIIEQNQKETNIKNTKRSSIEKLMKARLQVFLWGREFIWKIGKWRSKELNEFIHEFSPDMIFAQLQDKYYLNNLIDYVKSVANVPLYLYAWDDIYSYRQFSVSPLFWINKFLYRRSVRRVVGRCSLLYTISEEQKDEYAKTLGVRTRLLTKGEDFSSDFVMSNLNRPLHILYTGNLYSGRYPVISQVCKALQKINKDNLIATLDIYSGTYLTEKEISELNSDCTAFGGRISNIEVLDQQNKADVLLHIEPFSLKGRLLCRLSFSTKLVDYFKAQKCIVAIGSNVCSSIKYLTRENSAYVIDDESTIYNLLNNVLSDKELMLHYAQNAYNCGRRNHSKSDMQSRLLRDFAKTEA